MSRRGTMWGIVGLVCAVAACGGDDGGDPPDDQVVTTEHCAYEPVPPTGGAGGTVTAGALEAGAAEAVIEAPVSTALGAYTERAGFLGTTGVVDLREVPLSGSFNESIGVESAPMAKAVALSAGGETVVLIKLDLGLVYEGLVFEVERRLGPEFSGKVMITASHSHSAWGQQTANSIYKVGLGEFRDLLWNRYVEVVEKVARDALAARRPAKIGVFADLNFDPADEITRDRRGENDDLPGGNRKDDAFFMIRIDGTDDVPIAAMPVYGVHGTIMDADNSFASTDAPGAVERLLEETFDSPVVVMHLQGAGGDVSPTPHGGLNCDKKPGDSPDEPCFNWLRAEGHARAALPTMVAAYQSAGAEMKTDIALEMLSESIDKGPSPETFTVRDGALEYAPFERDRVADGVIYDSDGSIASPIDEFNAPVGAALCDADVNDPSTAVPMFPLGLMPGTDMLAPYGACVRVDEATRVLGEILELDFESDETHPVCQSTRTTISALRLGDYLIGTMPGEVTVPLADRIRDHSPLAADKTIVIGYAQGHIGYALTAEDWLSGGYEPSINIFGPLEAEYITERLYELFPLALSPEREDGAALGSDRLTVPTVTDNLPIDNPAPMAGTIPGSVPERVWTRIGARAQAQPDATIQRVSGHAAFVWMGDDPQVKTPVVTLEHETSPGVFEAVRRRSGRTVHDAELLLSYTPQPLRREGNEPQTHYWAAEWQAVPWIGAVDGNGAAIDTLDSIAAVPLGNYRFRVVGDNFDITSDPFQVTEAPLTVFAQQNGSTVTAQVTVLDDKGYRLLSMTRDSNETVGLKSGTFGVTIEHDGGADLQMDVDMSGSGDLVIDASGAGNITRISVTDPHGNTGAFDM